MFFQSYKSVSLYLGFLQRVFCSGLAFMKRYHWIMTDHLWLQDSIAVVVQPLSHIQLSVTPWTVVLQAISQSLLKLMSIELVMLSNHLILCCTVFLLPSVFPSFRVFSSESVLHIRWPKYWNFSFSISPSNEYSVLISLWCSGFFMAQLSHPYVTTEQTIALTI